MKKITEERLAEMWCELNRFVVPKEFKRNRERYWQKHDDISDGAMALIQILVGKKKINEAWRRDQAGVEPK